MYTFTAYDNAKCSNALASVHVIDGAYAFKEMVRIGISKVDTHSANFRITANQNYYKKKVSPCWDAGTIGACLPIVRYKISVIRNGKTVKTTPCSPAYSKKDGYGAGIYKYSKGDKKGQTKQYKITVYNSANCKGASISKLTKKIKIK